MLCLNSAVDSTGLWCVDCGVELAFVVLGCGLQLCAIPAGGCPHCSGNSASAAAAWGMHVAAAALFATHTRKVQQTQHQAV
jgi:hypothetical protein